MLSYLKFHHIGIATSSIEKTSQFYLQLGYVMSEPVADEIQDVRISFLSKKSMPTIELLEPVDEKSPVVNILTKMGGASPYHCCYVVSDLAKAIKELRKLRFIQLSKIVPAIAIDNNKVCFLYNKDVGLIELVEIPE